MVTFRTLAEADFDRVLQTFGESFGDYVVPFSLTARQLRALMTRRGVRFEWSVGVFDDEKLVAFTLNAVDGETAYDSGTGVIPSHRRSGLAKGMMEFVVPILRAAGARHYLLEVIQSNDRALHLYQSIGFTTTRALSCWKFAPAENELTEVAIRPIEPDWSELARFRDFDPSWQNADASMERAGDRRVVLGAFDDQILAGYAVVFPETLDLAQLAVRRSHRRRGIGSALLRRAARESGGSLRALNIDTRDAGIAAFLERSGGTMFIQQFEMVRAL